mgnify:FL=1
MSKKLFLLTMSLCFVGCANNIMKDCIEPHTLIFLNMTNEKDTCMIWTSTSSLYYELNIKCMSEKDFYGYLEEIIEKKQVLIVSDDYFLMSQKQTNITRSDIADSIYNEYGLEGLKHYIENSPLVTFVEADQEAFIWAAYLLWRNNILVSIDDESASWYIEE